MTQQDRLAIAFAILGAARNGHCIDDNFDPRPLEIVALDLVCNRETSRQRDALLTVHALYGALPDPFADQEEVSAFKGAITRLHGGKYPPDDNRRYPDIMAEFVKKIT